MTEVNNNHDIQVNNFEQKQQENKENLTPEQERIQELRKEYEDIKGSKKFVGKMEGDLRNRLLKDGDPKDKEYQELALKVKNYQEEIKGLDLKSSEVEQELSKLLGEINDEISQVSPEEIESLKDISNKEFLEVSKEKRLQYVTKNNVDYSQILDGSINSVEFTFDKDADGKDNGDLYRLTTIGQVMGPEVGSVECNGNIYTRAGLNGEFFNGNSRLIIHTGTRVEVNNLRTQEELNSLKDGVDKGLEKYKDLGNPDIVKESLERGIDPEFAVKAISEKVKDMPIGSVERKVNIEDILTNFDRLINIYKIDYQKNVNGEPNKVPDELAIRLLYLISPNNYKEIAKSYGIDEKSINTVSNTGLSNVIIDFEKISGGDLSKVDFRVLRAKYPNEASIKNNNPAGLTYSNTFANTLRSHGIEFYKGTSRPSSEGGSYFGFPNMEEGMNAYNLLWEIKLRKMGNKTFGEFAKNWAVDYHSYKNQFGEIWNQKLATLDQSYIDIIKSKQMRIESPGMYRELKKLDAIV